MKSKQLDEIMCVEPLSILDSIEILHLIELTMPSILSDADEALNSVEMWKKRIMWGHRCTLDNSLVACCGLYDKNNISWFTVHPYYQHKGLGQRMLDLLIAQCEVDVLYVETYFKAEFAKANAFYLKNGFTLNGIVLPETVSYKKELK